MSDTAVHPLDLPRFTFISSEPLVKSILARNAASEARSIRAPLEEAALFLLGIRDANQVVSGSKTLGYWLLEFEEFMRTSLGPNALAEIFTGTLDEEGTDLFPDEQILITDAKMGDIEVFARKYSHLDICVITSKLPGPDELPKSLMNISFYVLASDDPAEQIAQLEREIGTI